MRHILNNLILISLLLATLGCTSDSQPVAPDTFTPQPGVKSDHSPTSHNLLGYFNLRITEDLSSVEVIPIRASTIHFNVLNYLEVAPCTDCLTIQIIGPGTEGILINITIKNPFENMSLTSFDVRGIVMFNGSHTFPESSLTTPDYADGVGEILNPDGYTTLYNWTTAGSGPGGLQGYLEGQMALSPPPSALLNGYMRHITDDPANTRNWFLASDSVTVTYNIKIPNAGNSFGYAIDASWKAPISTPVDDPETDFPDDANCPEPWSIEVTGEPIGDGFTLTGGKVNLIIDVYDHQGKESHFNPFVECDEVFDGRLEASWVEDHDDFTRYSIEIENEKLPTPGTYKCLISCEDHDNSSAPSWLELIAYQVYEFELSDDIVFNINEVTPPWFNNRAYGVAVEDNYAYVTAGTDFMYIYDISVPVSPTWVRSVPVSEYTNNIIVEGGYAYLTDYSGTVSIVDIDPVESAHLVNAIDSFDYPLDLAIKDGYLYVTDRNIGLIVIDVDPVADAQVINTLNTTYEIWELSIVDNFAYVTGESEENGISSLHIIDITIPGSESIITTCELDFGPECIDVVDGYAYLGGYYGEFNIVDIDPPETAEIVKTLQTTVHDPLLHMDVVNGYAYVNQCYTNDIYVFDVDPIETAHEINVLQLPGSGVTYIGGIEIANDYAFIGSGLPGFIVVDVSVPGSEEIAGKFITPNMGSGLSIQDDYIYLANVYDLQIIDNSDPLAPVVDNVLPSSLGSYYIVVTDDIGCCIFYNDQFRLIDVSDPANPVDICSLTTSDKARDIQVVNGYAYIVCGSAGLEIFDIDPPDEACKVNTVYDDGKYTGVDIDGEYAYVADYYGRLLIIDISSPESANIINTIETPDDAWKVDVSQGYAYIVEGENGGLVIIDVEDPMAAEVINYLDITSPCYNVTIAGGYAYISSYGFYIVDIDPPETAEVVGSFYEGRVNDICVKDGFLYSAVRYNGIHIYTLY